MQNKCATCRFFNPVPTPESELMEKGECRVKAPTVHLLVIPAPAQSAARVMSAVGQQGPAIMGQSVFPTVQADCWCGLHPEIFEGTVIDIVANSGLLD